ncbi:MAG: energy transducer TonB [Bordetella sp.]|nr:energy transducer TonB [Bordetella sp.]
MNRAGGAAILAMVVIGSGADALAEDQPGRRQNPVVIEGPAWVVPPQVDEGDYPAFAAYLGVSGSVSLECVATPQGSPENCLIKAERPTGLGFGDAAKRIILRHRLTPRRVNGVATPSKFVVSLPFIAEDQDEGETDEVPAWSGPEPSPALVENARRVVAAVGIPSLTERLGLEELSQDRRAAVLSWAEELFPSDEALAETIALGMARLWAKETTDRFILGENAPSITPQDTVSAFPKLDSAAIDAEMRRRYCAAYDCGPATD